MKKNKSRGITLISLVVTIIVLLILAGVSISVLTGENGIITRTMEAKEQTRIAEAREELNLIETEWNMKKEVSKNANLQNFLEEKKTKQNIDNYIDLQDGSYLVQRYNQETLLEPAKSRPQIWDGTTVSKELYGSGTVEDPFLIRNGADLKFLANAVSNKSTYTLEGQTKGYQYACYRQVKDIYLNDTSNFSQWNREQKQRQLKAFLPIGYKEEDNSSMFCGEYDGNNHIIDGLYINTPEKGWIGLFCYLGTTTNETNKVVDCKVCNVKLTNAYIRAMGYVGGIVGDAYNSTITNCEMHGSVTAVSGASTGGIGGYMGNVNLTNCQNYAQINGNYYVGGISGSFSSGKLENCYNYGKIYGYQNVAGITGICPSAGTIQNCNNSGEIIFNKSTNYCYYFGGISGGCSSSTISNCNNTGKITIEDPEKDNVLILQIGGISGITSNVNIINSNNGGNITINVKSLSSDYNLEGIDGIGGIGGIVGQISSETLIKNCNNTGTISTTPTQTTGNIVGKGEATIE